MLLLLILADDFTGALDTGVQFAACGIPTASWSESRWILQPVTPLCWCGHRDTPSARCRGLCRHCKN